jgi:adenine-specific DNA-methyltransferase
MDKLSMHTDNGVQRNMEKIAQLFPNCITEALDANGKSKLSVDFDKLRQELSDEVVEGRDERYQFVWPDKKKAILLANSPINATLRPCREGSVDFDNTQNLYIEGDNLDVLKCLKETYMGKVKMIYIDPPYNTGNDFVYNDDFSESVEDYLVNSGQYDEQGNKLVANTESNGRFHTDWLNMIYSRLKVARELLSDDGAIFISISEEEIENMKKVCNEIFGEDKFANSFITRRYDKNLNRQFMDKGLKSFNIGFEYILVYTKSNFLFKPVFKEASEERASTGYWKGFWNDANRPTMRYDILGFTPETGQWKWSKDVAYEAVENYKEYVDKFSDKMSLEEYWASTGKCKKFIRKNPNGKGKNAGVENWIAPADGILRNTNWTDILTSKADKSTQGLFDFPKNVDLIKILLQCATENDSLVLDFFSGSATTAHAVMQLNAEDDGTRKFIMVQLPELTNEKSDAFKAGYKNICQIGEERIRRAGAVIKEASSSKTLDTGFRILKLDSSNMLDVYYTPSDVKQEQLTLFTNNVKQGRSSEDLLFQVMLELGATLDSKIECSKVAGKEIFNVANGYLVACFDEEVNDDAVKAIAQMEPQYAVFQDSSMANDSTATNFEQIFKTYSPSTITKVI